MLREEWTVEPLHELIVPNQDRLRPWKPWAQREQTLEGLRAFSRKELTEWLNGRNLPAAIRSQDRLVGSVGVRIAPADCSRLAEVITAA